MEPVTETILAITEKFKTKLIAKTDSYKAKMLAARSSCLGKAEESRECKKLNREEMESESEHQEVSKMPQ
jgi:hypothetical protein